jgi:hypothetical protein
MPNLPTGDLCVLREPQGNDWGVWLCAGDGKQQRLKLFPTREEATEFALDERARRAQAGAAELVVHFPDDCPCCRRRPV